MKENQSQRTGSSPIPAAHDSKGGIGVHAPKFVPLQQEIPVGDDMPLEEAQVTTSPWPVIQPKQQEEQRAIPARFSLAAVHHPVLSSHAPVQLVGGLENHANHCFLNAVIQLLEKSYHDLFNPALNQVKETHAFIQKEMWGIITDLRADKIISNERVAQLRKDLNQRGLVASCTNQEDAQELMVRIVEYMISSSVNNYPYDKGHHLLLQGVATRSAETDITGQVPMKDYTSDPSGISEDNSEIGNGLIGIDINIYDSFEDFLYFLYGQGVTTRLGTGEELKVLKDGKQVYVNARTEKRSFLLLPDVITFYVKRFIGGKKIDRNFPMPDTVILVEEPLLSGPKRYKTYTREVIVRHVGTKTLSGGHYYAIKQEAGKDVRFNDEKKELPSPDDSMQGSLYSYRLSATKDALGFGEAAWQEVRPLGRTTVPDTTGKSLPKPSGNTGGKPPGGTAPQNGGNYYPALSKNPVPSDQIKGLPNRARNTGLGPGVVDCFINAILQLIAGAYTSLFDPAANPRANADATEIQKAVHALIRKINNLDPTPVADDDIIKLRQLLLKNKGVHSLFTQEDGGELMLFLLGLMTDVSGEELDLPQTDASARVKTTPGAFAQIHNSSIEDLVRKNPVLHERQISTRHREYLEKKDLANPSVIPDELATRDFHHTKWEEETEPAGNVIVIDIGRIYEFDEFLFQRYGKGWEVESFSAGEPAKQSLHVGKKPADIGFSKRLKRHRFTNLPPTLTFLVKRFTSDGATLKKNSRDYSLPEELILVEQPTGDKKVYKHYELKAIVVHTGKSMDQGHYYTHRREGEEGKDWVKADDRKVWKEISPGADLKKGYLYTYELKKTSDALQPGQQAPQEKYDLPATIYLADAKLRPTDAMGFATDPKHRNSQAQDAVSRDINVIVRQYFPGQKNVFHAGHLFNSTMGGDGDARNLTPMWGPYNLGGYKVFEDKDITALFKEATSKNQRLYIKVHADYPADDSPEAVFRDLFNPEDIQKLKQYYTLGVEFFEKQLETAKDTEKKKYQEQLGIARAVQLQYPHLLRTCRRIPIRMYNTEARLITFDSNGAYKRRGPNRRFDINGSPRGLLGKLEWKNFLSAKQPKERMYGGDQAIDFGGQDPDEWAVKTYAAMPEPGIFNYISDGAKAAGVDAYIWMDPEGIFSTFKFGGGTEDAGPAPQGFDWRLLNQAAGPGKGKPYGRAHLLNGKLHGSGNDPQNLSPFASLANLRMSGGFEGKVKQLPELTTPGKGIFWMSRLTGKVKRPDDFNSGLLAKKTMLGSVKGREKEKLELEIALAEEEAKMFDGIHLFAYEATVQTDGKLKRGKLLLSGYFENRFGEGDSVLGATRYRSLFKDNFTRMMTLGRLKEKFKVDIDNERDALSFLSDAISKEHANAAESYVKQPPVMTEDSPKFELEHAFKDIQATLNEQLPLYYAAYQAHLNNLATITKWNELITAFNESVKGLAGLRPKAWQVKYNKVVESRKKLNKTVSKYGEYRDHYLQLEKWFENLRLMAGQHHVLTGKLADYSAIKEIKVSSLKELAPDALPDLDTIRIPKVRKQAKEVDGDSSGRPKKKPRHIK